MKAQIVYLANHKESVKQSKEALKSFKSHGWDVELVRGITPKTLESRGRVTDLMENGRLTRFEDPRLSIKKSCVNNHILFWERVVEENETMAFIEHDAIAVEPPQRWKFSDVLVLNIHYAFKFGALRGKFRNLILPSEKEVEELPDNYPLRCRVEDSRYKGADMIPGTAAYAITPQGAEKMLTAVYKYGIDQSDYVINSMNVKLEYANPSPVKFNTVNLSTSNG